MKNQSNFNNILSILIVSITIAFLLTFVVIIAGANVLVKNTVPESEAFKNYDVAELYADPQHTSTVGRIEIKRILSEFPVRYEINRFITDDNILQVIEFYSQFTSSRKVSEAIIRGSLEYNIPINIGFALAWAESRFYPRAVNGSNANGSSDWGLFQLNDRYNHLTQEQFFNVYTNAYTGLRYLREMIDLNDDDLIYSLYSYNAGPTRVVVHGNIPRITIKYVENILEYEDMLNQEFNKWVDDLHS